VKYDAIIIIIITNELKWQHYLPVLRDSNNEPTSSAILPLSTTYKSHAVLIDNFHSSTVFPDKGQLVTEWGDEYSSFLIRTLPASVSVP